MKEMVWLPFVTGGTSGRMPEPPVVCSPLRENPALSEGSTEEYAEYTPLRAFTTLAWALTMVLLWSSAVFTAWSTVSAWAPAIEAADTTPHVMDPIVTVRIHRRMHDLQGPHPGRPPGL